MSTEGSDFAFGPLRDAVLELFTEHGVTGDVRYARPTGGDEAVFVVTTRGAAMMREGELTSALTSLLHRKVWVTTESDVWKGRTEPL